MQGWRAYFADGSRVDSSESSWAELHQEGLVGVVIFEEPPYRRIVAGHDWVWMEGGQILATGTADEWGRWEDAPEAECASCVKRGAAMSDEAWMLVQAEMQGDKRWP